MKIYFVIKQIVFWCLIFFMLTVGSYIYKLQFSGPSVVMQAEINNVAATCRAGSSASVSTTMDGMSFTFSCKAQ